MNVFKLITHFFASLFGRDGDTAQQVLHHVSSFVGLAKPIVEDIETTVKIVPDETGRLDAAGKFLSKYEPDVEQVQAMLGTFEKLGPADLARQLALAALHSMVPVGTASSVLTLAIELAYSIVKARQASVAAA